MVNHSSTALTLYCTICAELNVKVERSCADSISMKMLQKLNKIKNFWGVSFWKKCLVNLQHGKLSYPLLWEWLNIHRYAVKSHTWRGVKTLMIYILGSVQPEVFFSRDHLTKLIHHFRLLSFELPYFIFSCSDTKLCVCCGCVWIS